MKLEITDLLDKIAHLCGVAQSNRVQNPGLVAQQHTNILELITQYRIALKAEESTDAENADAGEVAHSEVERDSSGAPVDLTDADKLTPAGVDPAPSSGD